MFIETEIIGRLCKMNLRVVSRETMTSKRAKWNNLKNFYVYDNIVAAGLPFIVFQCGSNYYSDAV